MRALVVAAACVGVTLSAHVFAGGMVLPPRSLLLVYAAVGAVTYAVSGRRWTFGRLLLALGAAQVVLHPAFDVLGGGTPMGSTSATMVAAHLLAAVLLAMVMARGEAVLWRTAELVAELLRPLAAVFSIRGPVPAGTVLPALPAPAPELRVPASLVVAPSTERAPPRHG